MVREERVGGERMLTFDGEAFVVRLLLRETSCSSRARAVTLTFW